MTKILIVDDEKDIVETLGKRLAREGYEVVTALDGEEALLKVKVDNPDIVLLDLMLPKMNGFDVLKEIREKHADKWRPVIIISAKTEFEALRKCYTLEADQYLTKPCSMDDILRVIGIMVSLIPLRIAK